MTCPDLENRPYENAESIEASLLTWLAVHGYLCLALRHPGIQDVFAHPSSLVIQMFVEQLGERLVRSGVLTPEELEAAQQLETAEIAAQARCERCGCTETAACPGGCSWNEKYLMRGRYVCTNCEPASRIITFELGSEFIL